MADRTPAAGPARLTEREWNPITTAALKQVRKSLAALLLELPEAVWRGHKGIVETAISQMVQDQLTMRAENARYRAALEELVWATTVHGDVTVCDYCGVPKDEPGKDPTCSCAPLRAALAAPGAGETTEGGSA